MLGRALQKGASGPPSPDTFQSREVTELALAGAHPLVLGFSPHSNRLILAEGHHAPTSVSPDQLTGRRKGRSPGLSVSYEAWIPASLGPGYPPSSLLSGPCLDAGGAASICSIPV